MDFESIQPDLFYSSSARRVVPSAILESGKVCASFTRQELAFDYFDKLAWHQRLNCKIYSFESIHSGKRMFLVAEYSKFCKDYFKSSEYRHVYEIIRDGFPCRLYFDLEFPILQNPTANGDNLTMKWIDLVVAKSYSLHDTICSHQVVVLDSCTPEKYSKHVTIRLFGQADCTANNKEKIELLLPDNLEIGYIMNLLLMDITSPHEYSASSFNATSTSVENSLETNESHSGNANPSVLLEVQGRRRTPLPVHLDMFLLNKDGTKRTCFVDLGVYTRNRAFRLFYSCKYGKTKRLEVKSSDVNTFQMKLVNGGNSGNLSLMRRDWLTQSLVVPHDLFNGQPLEDDQKSKRRKLDSKESTESESVEPVDPEVESSNSYLRCVNSDRYLVLPSLNPEGNTSGLIAKDRSNAAGQRFYHQGGGGVWRSNEIARSTHNREPSWFPALDEYVTLHCASVGGVKGVLNGWSLTSTSSCDSSDSEAASFTFYKLKYQVLYNRYCGNIQRHHKSNGIMLEVDLIQRTVVQSCWDADCRGYKSPPVYLPEHLIPEVAELQSMVMDYQINLAIKKNPQDWVAVL